MRAIAGITLLMCAPPTLAAGTVPPAGVTEFATLTAPAGVRSVVFAKTGQLVGAECADGKLRMWKLPDRSAQREIDLTGRSVDALVMSTDGGQIAIGDHHGAYTVWDTSTGAIRAQGQLPFYPSAMAFSHDGKTLAIAPTGDPVQLFDVASGRKLLELGHATGGTVALAFSRDDRRIGMGDGDTVVRIYDVRTGALLAHNEDLKLEPLAVDFSADGSQLMAGGADKIIVAVDTKSGTVVRKSAGAVDPIAYLEVSADGRWVAAALMLAANLTEPAPVLISELASGRIVQAWTPANLVRGGTWTTDGRLLAATASGNVLHIWRVR